MVPEVRIAYQMLISLPYPLLWREIPFPFQLNRLSHLYIFNRAKNTNLIFHQIFIYIIMKQKIF